MDLAKITQDNVATACRIQHQLFPGKDINADRECPKWGDRDIGLWRQFTKQIERLYE